MKTILALVLLAALGFATAGCGATKKIVVDVKSSPVASYAAAETRTITVVGSTTTAFPTVVSSMTIKCKGWPGRGVKVPPAGSEANVGEGEATPSGTAQTSHQMQVTHLRDGSVTVFCTSK